MLGLYSAFAKFDIPPIVTTETKAPMPPAGVLCVVAGILVIIGGVLMVAQVVSSSGSDAAMALALATLLSSIIWFAMARALALLAQIAHNTRRVASPSTKPQETEQT